MDLVNKSGAWYAYNGNKIGQGRENAKQYLSEHPDIMTELETKVREALRSRTGRGVCCTGALSPEVEAEEE